MPKQAATTEKAKAAYDIFNIFPCPDSFNPKILKNRFL